VPGLLGHSDADVLTHALCDALLGSLALGDIGQHFPDTDPNYRGIDSLQLLIRSYALLRSKGYHLVNADCTVICERPRIAPQRTAIAERLAAILDVSVDKLSIKATTSERMGAMGREEGIAASAIVCVAQMADRS
jgi:2-C-methyl-D-erythritol 2,4-cyclodiphosphate synthase